MILGYDTLENFLRTNWALMQHHKYDMDYIENRIAWERQIYVTLLSGYMKEEAERLKLEKMRAGK